MPFDLPDRLDEVVHLPRPIFEHGDVLLVSGVAFEQCGVVLDDGDVVAKVVSEHAVEYGDLPLALAALGHVAERYQLSPRRVVAE